MYQMIKRGRWFLIASFVKKSYIENLAMLTKRQFPPLFQSRIDSALGAVLSRSHSVRVEFRHGQWLELVRRESISIVRISRTTLHYWASRMWPRAVPSTSGLCMAPHTSTAPAIDVGSVCQSNQNKPCASAKQEKWELIAPDETCSRFKRCLRFR